MAAQRRVERAKRAAAKRAIVVVDRNECVPSERMQGVAGTAIRLAKKSDEGEQDS